MTAKADITVTLHDGTLMVDGAGDAVDFVAVADAALAAAEGVVGSTCGCAECVSVRRLRAVVATSLRGWGGSPVPTPIAFDAAAAVATVRRRAH